MHAPIWIRGFFIVLLVTTLGLAVACDELVPDSDSEGTPEGDASNDTSQEDAEAKARRDAWTARLEEIAGEYPIYGAVDDESRWAPFLCRMPKPRGGPPQRSRREHAARAPSSTRSLPPTGGPTSPWVAKTRPPRPIGQVLVKEGPQARRSRDRPVRPRATPSPLAPRRDPLAQPQRRGRGPLGRGEGRRESRSLPGDLELPRARGRGRRSAHAKHRSSRSARRTTRRARTPVSSSCSRSIQQRRARTRAGSTARWMSRAR